MATDIKPLTQRPAWKALAAHHQQIQKLPLRKLFADDAKRGQRFTVEAAGLFLDFSKNCITDQTLKLLLQLAGEAMRGGFGQAKNVLFWGDGAPWIWNLKHDRWSQAIGLLDCYHASQHCWNRWRTVRGENDPKLAPWMERRLHWLRHGHDKKVLREIAGLSRRGAAAAKIIEREQGCFAAQAQRMNYQEIARRGWPIGSGAVESACRQKQCRFKRPGQFWTRQGLGRLTALEEARRNHHWTELWN